MHMSAQMPVPTAHIEFAVFRAKLPVRCERCGAAAWRSHALRQEPKIQRIVQDHNCKHCGHVETVYTDFPMPEPGVLNHG